MIDVLSPERPRLAEALTVALGYAPELPLIFSVRQYLETGDDRHVSEARRRGLIGDPRELWETLASRGVTPAEWIDDPRRRFISSSSYTVWMPSYPEEGQIFTIKDHRGDAAMFPIAIHTLNSVLFVITTNYGYISLMAHRAPDGSTQWIQTSKSESGTVLPQANDLYPKPVADCITLASDVNGVLTAESIAKEVTGRDCVTWRVLRGRELENTRWMERDGAYRQEQYGEQGWKTSDRDALIETGYVFGGVTEGGVVLCASSI